ncbi:F-box domain containing protein [Tanacetum coccineum]
MMAVIWNPSIRKYVSIVIPNVSRYPGYAVIIGFGVCPDDTSDPKLVKINVNKIKIPYTWVVEVFTFSTRVWKTVYMGAPFKLCDLIWDHVFIDGIIYWRIHTPGVDEGFSSNYIISFDLKREKFYEVSLRERLARSHGLLVLAKVTESLHLLEYYIEGEIWNNGEVVLAMEDDNDIGYAVVVYEPSSRYINGVGINSKYLKFSAVSYMETLLLLHESNSIVH